MLLLSSKQILDNFTDIMIKSASENYSLKYKNFNINFLQTAVKIRNILQKLLNKVDDIYIDNVYSKKKVNINYIFNTVYLKGGIITDYFISNNIESLVISDLDFHVELIDINVLKKDYKKLCIINRTIINKMLKWFIKYFIDPNNEIILNKLFDGQDVLQIYNSYNVNSVLKKFNRNTTYIKSDNYNLHFICNEINDTVILIRYFYLFEIKDKITNDKMFLKINIIDFSINHIIDNNTNIYSSSILQSTYFTKTDFIITQSKLSILNDQLKTLINAIVTGSQKILKRKIRVKSLLSTITKKELIESNVYICKYNNIPNYFLKDLKNNKIIELIAQSKMFYPFILVPFIIWFIKNSKYIKNKIYNPQVAEFYYINNLINKSNKDIENGVKNSINTIISNFKDILDIINLFYKILDVKQIKNNKFIINDKIIYNKLSNISTNILLNNYRNLHSYTNYRNNIKYWNKFITNQTLIDDEHLYLYLKLKNENII
jgi:hypothetical protein